MRWRPSPIPKNWKSGFGQFDMASLPCLSFCSQDGCINSNSNQSVSGPTGASTSNWHVPFLMACLRLESGRVLTLSSGHNNIVLRPTTYHCVFCTSTAAVICPVLVALLPVASLGLVILSQVEHRRSVKPSSPILLYLLTSALCDAVQLTIPSLRYVDNHGDRLIIGLHLAAETTVSTSSA